MKELFKALAGFQQEVPVILKDTQAYGYKYADLPAILEVINPLMRKYGLGFTQLLDGTCLKTIIFHVESGELLEASTEIPQNVQLKGMNDFQVLGSAITYIRRYALSSALGLITDKDTDASGDQIKPTVAVAKPIVLRELTKDSPEFAKAKQYIQTGEGTIATIKKSYTLSEETIKLLTGN